MYKLRKQLNYQTAILKEIPYSNQLSEEEEVALIKKLVKEAQEKTGLNEAVITGEGVMDTYRVAIGLFDFAFLGGSMASVVGEKVCRLIERAGDRGIPLVTVAASGGA